jgi:hypothetical protein
MLDDEQDHQIQFWKKTSNFGWIQAQWFAEEKIF